MNSRRIRIENVRGQRTQIGSKMDGTFHDQQPSLLGRDADNPQHFGIQQLHAVRRNGDIHATDDQDRHAAEIARHAVSHGTSMDKATVTARPHVRLNLDGSTVTVVGFASNACVDRCSNTRVMSLRHGFGITQDTEHRSLEIGVDQSADSLRTSTGNDKGERSIRSTMNQLIASAAHVNYALMATPGVMWNALDEQLDHVDSQIHGDLIVVGAAGAAASSFTVGVVAWALRTGFLASGLLAQMPAWRAVDPLLIMQGFGDDESEETLEEMMKRQSESLGE